MAALSVNIEVGEEEKEKMESISEAAAEKERMKPWEQHAGVINMPRFDYNAPSALLHHSHSGFLITCSISKFPLFFSLFLFIINLFIVSLILLGSQAKTLNAQISYVYLLILS
jgi:hypothetical protein